MYKTPLINGWILVNHMIFPFALNYPISVGHKSILECTIVNQIYSITLEWAMLIVLWEIDEDDYFILYYFCPWFSTQGVGCGSVEEDLKEDWKSWAHISYISTLISHP